MCVFSLPDVLVTRKFTVEFNYECVYLPSQMCSSHEHLQSKLNYECVYLPSQILILLPASGERFNETLTRPNEVVLWPSGPHGTFYREVVAQGWDRFPSSDFHFAPCLRGALQRRSFLEILSLSELGGISVLSKEI